MDISNTSDNLSLMKEKKELLNEMLLLTEDQSRFIKDEDVKELEVVLVKKDLVIDKINEIDSKLRSFKFKEDIDNRILSDELLKINEILQKIKTLDDENNKNLSKAMTDMKDGLKEVRQGMRAMQNYSNSDPYHAFASQGGTLFIDQDS